MIFPNLYYKRCQTAATAKACYICYKPTTTVLATIDTADFLYTCPIHLTDRGFATRAPDTEPEPKKASVSPEEIARVKQEWEERQRFKRGKDKTEGKEGDQADGDGQNGAGGTHKDVEGKDVETRTDAKQEKQSAGLVPTPSPSPSQEPLPSARPMTHERYILHRDIFALRTTDHRRRRQATQAKNLAPRLPGAPRSLLS